MFEGYLWRRSRTPPPAELCQATRAIDDFIKTTLIGGVLVVVPLYLSVLLLLKALAGLSALVAPITQSLPDTLQSPRLFALLLLVAICFACGVAVRIGPGRRAKDAIEQALLEKIPGYKLIRGLTGRIAGKEGEETFEVVLVEIEDALVPAFFVEGCVDGQCAVFVPSVPTPAAGAIYIIAKSRVHPVDASLGQAVAVISKWGTGSSALLEGMKRAQQKARLAV